jgi:hydroxypyruvate reductase
VLSAGTDGIDGDSPAAGAVVDGGTIARAQALNLDPQRALAKFDSFPWFEALGDTIMTGPTGNNVRDLRVPYWFAVICLRADPLYSGPVRALADTGNEP